MILLIKLTTIALVSAIALFGLAGILWAIWDWKPKCPSYQKPRTYEREPESQYQNLIDEHTKL